MNNTNQQRLVEQLLAQDPPLTDEQYRDYRLKISHGIRTAHKQRRLVRMVTQVAWAMTALVLFAGFLVDFHRDAFPETVRLGVIAATIACLACAVALLAIYLINYRPRLRSEEQEAMLLGLQRQLHELRRQMPPSMPQPSPAQKQPASPNSGTGDRQEI